MIFKKNKQALGLLEDVVVYVFAIVIISLLLFFSSLSIASTDDKVEKLAPEISYQYPKSVVVTFLNIELSEEQREKVIEEVGGVFGFSSIKVEDILGSSLFDQSDVLQEVVFEIREEFVDLLSLSSIKNFEEFSGKKMDFEILIIAKDNKIPKRKGDNCIYNVYNSLYYLPILGDNKNLNSEYRLIYFEKPDSSCYAEEINDKIGYTGKNLNSI